MRFLLDTNVVIGLLNRHSVISARILAHKRRDHALSAVVAHELYFGAFRSVKRDETIAALESLRIPILDFTVEDARRAAEIRATLAASGTPIGPYDILIACQALARNLTLVTRNTREFARVPGLTVENWENGNA